MLQNLKMLKHDTKLFFPKTGINWPELRLVECQIDLPHYTAYSGYLMI